MKRFVIGTRGSKLALAQTNKVADALRQAHPDLEIAIQVITTRGDRVLDVALSKVGDKGVFVTEIENALSQGEIDLAVHSAKDLPSQLAHGLTLGAIPTRANPADVLVLRAPTLVRDPLAALAQGAQVGSSSLRRASQLRALRPDLRISDVRGNVDTRLRKLAEGHYDALVLAAAGLARLGMGQAEFESEGVRFSALHFDIDTMLPAVAQGALGIECRAEDTATLALLKPLDDIDTHACVLAERALLRRLEGGCQVPIAAYATLSQRKLHLRGLIASLDGTAIVRAQGMGHMAQASDIGTVVAEQLLADGGAALIAAYATVAPITPST